MVGSSSSSGSVGRKKDVWSSRFGFLMAAIGSSVGLGNFWRFPYTAGENGGAAFILAYLVAVAFIALPILIAEYALGRKSGQSAVEGIRTLARRDGRSEKWAIAGWVGLFTSFFILSFYNVICAWILAFIPQAASGAFADFASKAASANTSVAEIATANFEQTTGNTAYMITLLGAFISANISVLALGIKRGLETAAKLLMPLFFVMLAFMVIYAAYTGDFAATAKFVLQPKWEDVGFGTLLAAIGQAFFSVGVGVGLMLTYGSYLPANIDIPRSSVTIAACDTLVALVAGFAIFPIIFAFGVEATGGPGLFFISMPLAFGEMAGGQIIGAIFFFLALFAAFTSSLSLMEIPVSWLEERSGTSRFGATLGVGVALFMIGSAHIFSMAYLDFIDFLTEGLLLPLGGLLIAVFAGHAMGPYVLHDELSGYMSERLIKIYFFLLRHVIPPLILLVLVIGFFDKLHKTYGIRLHLWD